MTLENATYAERNPTKTLSHKFKKAVSRVIGVDHAVKTALLAFAIAGGAHIPPGINIYEYPSSSPVAPIAGKYESLSQQVIELQKFQINNPDKREDLDRQALTFSYHLLMEKGISEVQFGQLKKDLQEKMKIALPKDIVKARAEFLQECQISATDPAKTLRENAESIGACAYERTETNRGYALVTAAFGTMIGGILGAFGLGAFGNRCQRRVEEDEDVDRQMQRERDLIELQKQIQKEAEEALRNPPPPEPTPPQKPWQPAL